MNRRALGLLLIGALFSSNNLFSQVDSSLVELRPLAEMLEESMLIQGTISQQLGDHDQAIDSFLLGLEKNANSPPLLLSLSESYFALEDFASARFYIDQARKLDATEPLLVAQHLQILIAEKDIEAAKLLLQQASTLGIFSRDLQAMEDQLRMTKEDEVEVADLQNNNETFSALLDTLNSIDEASFSPTHSERLKKSIANTPLKGHQKSYLLARVHYNSGDYDEAIEALERATKDNPKNVSAWAFLIKATSKNGQQERAKRFSQQAELLFPFQQEIILAEVLRLIESNLFAEARSKLIGLEFEGHLQSEKDRLSALLEAK